MKSFHRLTGHWNQASFVKRMAKVCNTIPVFAELAFLLLRKDDAVDSTLQKSVRPIGK
jgi:hypothetical protein